MKFMQTVETKKKIYHIKYKILTMKWKMGIFVLLLTLDMVKPFILFSLK